MYIFSEESLKLLLSVVVGSVIGIEREYRSKAAGFRTMTLICIGSALFTIVSIKLGSPNNADRIAANIITGIGFLGAGVVFKDGFSVTGITTATAIWVTAALGMTIGIGDYTMAGEGMVLVIIILSIFEYIQNIVDDFHQKRVYKISFDKNQMQTTGIEKELAEIKLKFMKMRELKSDDELTCFYEIYGSKRKFEDFNNFLVNSTKVRSFDC